MKPGTSGLRFSRRLDQVRERIRYLHYSLQTEKADLHWVRFFIRWHGRDGVNRVTKVRRTAGPLGAVSVA